MFYTLFFQIHSAPSSASSSSLFWFRFPSYVLCPCAQRPPHRWTRSQPSASCGSSYQRGRSSQRRCPAEPWWAEAGAAGVGAAAALCENRAPKRKSCGFQRLASCAMIVRNLANRAKEHSYCTHWWTYRSPLSTKAFCDFWVFFTCPESICSKVRIDWGQVFDKLGTFLFLFHFSFLSLELCSYSIRPFS